MSNLEQFDFDDEFEQQLLAFLVRDVKFYLRNKFSMKPNYFVSKVREDVFKRASMYMDKYNEAITHEALRQEITQMFKDQKKKDVTIDMYFELMVDLYSRDLTGGGYAEDKVLAFAQSQEMANVLRDAVKRITGNKDLRPILTGVTKALAIGTESETKDEGGESMVELINSKIDEPEYLVRPFIKPGEKGYLVAGYKVGKTFYLLQEILSLAQGASDFLGFEIPKPRKVLYIRFELSRYEVQRRLRQMLRKLHKEMSQDPMLFLKKGFDLTNPDEKDLNWLFGQIDLCEPDFLIFDPLFKLTSLNLAEPKSATPLLRAYEKILIRYPKLSIQTAHHMVKMSKDKDSDSWDSSYGPVQFFADMDYEMRLRKIRDEEPKRFKLDFLTNSELVDKIELERDPSTLLYKVVKESPMQKKAYEDQANLEAMSRILKRSGRINQTTFEKSCKEELSIGQDLFKRLSGLGSDIGYSGFGGYTQHPFWKKSKIKNLVFYEPCDIGG